MPMKHEKMHNDKARLDILIGTNIRKEREHRKITREELAVIVGLSASHIGLIERAERGATPVTLQKLAKAFDVPIDSFFAEHDNVKPTNGKCKNEPGVYYKKVAALLPRLTEAELKPLAQIINGILAMRKVSKIKWLY